MKIEENIRKNAQFLFTGFDAEFFFWLLNSFNVLIKKNIL